MKGMFNSAAHVPTEAYRMHADTTMLDGRDLLLARHCRVNASMPIVTTASVTQPNQVLAKTLLRLYQI